MLYAVNPLFRYDNLPCLRMSLVPSTMCPMVHSYDLIFSDVQPPVVLKKKDKNDAASALWKSVVACPISKMFKVIAVDPFILPRRLYND